MRLLVITLLFFFTENSYGRTYYISVKGNDANPGTLAKPWRTLQKINSIKLKPGDIVYVRAGTYLSESSDIPLNSLYLKNINGTSANWIIIAAYPGDFPKGGRVVFDCSDYKYTTRDHVGIRISDCSYLKIKGIRVTGIPQTYAGQVCMGWWIADNRNGHITLQNCESDHIGNTGFRVDDTNNASFVNCDAHHIDNPYDPGIQHHGGSDGFGRYGSSNNSDNTIYSGCRSWFCSDDGWDLFDSPGKAIWDSCWSFWNGYAQDVFPLTHTYEGDTWGDGNGFKFGGGNTPVNTSTVMRVISNCMAFENYDNGFDQNDAPIKAQFSNNISYKNGGVDYNFGFRQPIAHVFKNNVSYQNKGINGIVESGRHWIQSNNSWNRGIVKENIFVSLVSKGVDGPRQPDGSLPNLSFLRLSGSR